MHCRVQVDLGDARTGEYTNMMRIPEHLDKRKRDITVFSHVMRRVGAIRTAGYRRSRSSPALSVCRYALLLQS